MGFVNTIEFNFGKNSQISLLAVHRWLKSLGIENDHLYGVMPVVLASTRLVRVKLKTRELYDNFLAKYEGTASMATESGEVKVTISPAGTRERFVRLQDVPFEAEMCEIKEVMSKYGKVLTTERVKYLSSVVNDYFPTLSGAVTVKMVISIHIPSFLRIGGERVLVKYQGQPATCYVCNKPGHIAARCDSRQRAQEFPGKWAKKPQQTVGKDTQENIVTPERDNSQAMTIAREAVEEFPPLPAPLMAGGSTYANKKDTASQKAARSKKEAKVKLVVNTATTTANIDTPEVNPQDVNLPEDEKNTDLRIFRYGPLSPDSEILTLSSPREVRGAEAFAHQTQTEKADEMDIDADKLSSGSGKRKKSPESGLNGTRETSSERRGRRPKQK